MTSATLHRGLILLISGLIESWRSVHREIWLKESLLLLDHGLRGRRNGQLRKKGMVIEQNLSRFQFLEGETFERRVHLVL